MLNPPHYLPTLPCAHAWIVRSTMASWPRARAVSLCPFIEALTPMPI